MAPLLAIVAAAEESSTSLHPSSFLSLPPLDDDDNTSTAAGFDAIRRERSASTVKTWSLTDNLILSLGTPGMSSEISYVSLESLIRAVIVP